MKGFRGAMDWDDNGMEELQREIDDIDDAIMIRHDKNLPVGDLLRQKAELERQLDDMDDD